MRVGIFADSHDHLANLRLIVDYFNRAEVELVLFAGDLVSTFAVPPLRKLKAPFVGCFGDNEGNKVGLLAGFSLVGKIGEPPLRHTAADGTRFILCHMERQLRGEADDWDIAVFGHTHKPRIKTDDAGRLLINPGEASGWTFGRPTCVVLETSVGEGSGFGVQGSENGAQGSGNVAQETGERFFMSRRDSILSLVAVVNLSLAATAIAAEPTPAQALVAAPRVLISAHRGNSSVAPENTLPAFQSALDVKADLVELDYFHSADGVPVVIHDEILGRADNSEEVLGQPKLLIGNLKLADIQKLDVGLWFADKFAGTKLPTLSESLDLIQSKSVTLIERKGGDAKTLVKLLEEKKLTGRVVVQAFDWEFIADCRRLAPRLALGTLSSKPPSEEQLRGAAATGADLIVWNHEKIGAIQIKQIHDLGKKAWVYTVDEPARAQALIAAGIDGIITNTPAAMIQLRNSERGTRNP